MLTLYLLPGIFGTRAGLLSDLSMVLILLSAALFTAGVFLAKRRRFRGHCRTQNTATILNSAVVLLVMVTVFVSLVIPEMRRNFSAPGVWLTVLHSFIGAIGVVLGVFVTLGSNGVTPKALPFEQYRPFMRTSYAVYMVSTLLGVIVYAILFIF